MREYETYKDSGVEWIGEIPVNWDLFPSWVVLTHVKEKGTPQELDTKISPENVQGFTGQVTNYSSDYSGEGWVFQVNDTLFNKLRTYLNKVYFCDRHGFSMGEMIVLRPTNVVPKFLYYTFTNTTHVRYLESHSKGVKQPRTDPYDILHSKIPLPSIPEQEQIVSFLDERTSLVDEIIENKTQRIELLKEMRSSLICEVVTKGLNPDVPMKDSGVEWIGEIPSHWEVKSGSRIGSYSKGRGISKDDVRDKGLPCIRYGEIYTRYHHSVSNVISRISEELSLSCVSVENGTLLLTSSGETVEDIGKCVVFVGDGRLFVGGDIITLVPDKQNDSRFLSYLINSGVIGIQRSMCGRGDIIVHISTKHFRVMKFPIPPLPEQEQIVSFLDERTFLIDEEISREERSIDYLNEIRQSLIHEVVTGKRDVRGGPSS